MTEEVKPVENVVDEAEMETDLDPAIVEGITDEDSKKNLGTTIAQKNYWRDKAKKLAEDPRLKVPAPVEKPKPKPKAKADDFDPEAYKSQLKDELRMENKYPDITEDEMNKAKALAQIEGKRISEVVEDPYFQGYMKTNREKMAIDKARPNPSNRGGNPSGGSMDDLSDSEKVDRMDPKTYSELMKKAKNQRHLSSH